MSAASRKFKKFGGPMASLVLGVVAAIFLPSADGLFVAAGGGVVVSLITRNTLPCVLAAVVGFFACFLIAGHTLHVIL